MKVCIVTLIKSNNSGSYWQARALGLTIEKLGHSVCYYDFDYTLEFKLKEFKRLLGMIVHLGKTVTQKYIDSNKAFSKTRNKLTFVKNNQDFDFVVLGSDTIWNLESKNLYKNFDILWGSAFPNHEIISYAGSVANARKELFENNERIKSSVSLWSRIGVRDEYTRQILTPYTDKEIELVCDPTLLLTKQDYVVFHNNDLKDEFIYLYLFKDLSDEQNNALKEFARDNNLKIIQGVNGIKLKSSDYTVVNSPLNFLDYMIAAKYVVTDTFHGTIFSINLNKQFVSINRGKNKVIEAVRTLKFEDRLVSNSDSFINILNTSIDYDERMQYVEDFRSSSCDFLRKSLTCN